MPKIKITPQTTARHTNEIGFCLSINDSFKYDIKMKPNIKGRKDRYLKFLAWPGNPELKIINASSNKDITNKFTIKLAH